MSERLIVILALLAAFVALVVTGNEMWALLPCVPLFFMFFSFE